ncbi:MAG: class I tRNA ligase family protein, partial [Candidatus Dependentiae bacterium]|nr:class I tRNA ligase family protein [Candidatus Dependentiae bacterium]
RFHAIYWPAFLMASGLEMPKKLLVHGWIKVGDAKMSKSLGNAVDPRNLAEQYGVDQIRYYLTRKMAITQDSEFSIADIEQCINSELADDLGNLLNRCSTLAEKYNYTTIQGSASWNPESIKLQQQCEKMIQESLALIEQGFFYRAVNHVWEYINQVNSYFHASEPWKLAVSNPEKFQETIAATVYSLRAIAVMLWPVMPQKMEMLLESIGYKLPEDRAMLGSLSSSLGSPRGSSNEISFDSWNDRLTIKKIETLFKKYEKIMEEKTIPAVAPEVEINYASIEDFAKIDLRLGTIFQCEIVEKSDKLLKLQVDFGDFGKRQIFSGMRKYFKPEDLIGKQAVFVVNFKPRMMMGMPSEGMMLTADGALVTVSSSVANGAQVR